MARKTAVEVPIYSPHKAVALVMAGNIPTNSLELDGHVVAWFQKNDKFDADCVQYDTLRPVAAKAKDPRSSIGLADFLRVVEKARKQ
jgi:hypothetical protein